jgi:GNAT superfamily N-acetyltransferase
MRLRPTTSADLEAMHGVFLDAIGDLYRRHGFDAPAPPLEVFAAQQRHLLEHDGRRCWVAQEGTVVAFAAAFVRGGTWFLSSLFVRPDAQGAGLGSALLDRVWWPEAERRLTVTDAIQPVSNGLYGRRGLIPATPVLTFAGVPEAEGPAGLEASEPDCDALRALDLAGYGFDRAVDHELWRRSARLTLWRRGGRPAAYSYAWPSGTIGPLVAADGEDAADALRAELSRRGGAQALVRVPGSAAAAVEIALAAGLRLAQPPGLLLLSRPGGPPASLVPGSYTLL